MFAGNIEIAAESLEKSGALGWNGMSKNPCCNYLHPTDIKI